MNACLTRFRSAAGGGQHRFIWGLIWVTGLAGSILLQSVFQAAWAVEPRDLPGKWKDKNNIEYEVEVQGTQFRMRVLNSPDKSCKLYQGAMLQGEFNIACRVTTLDDIGKNLPMKIRELLIQQGYLFRATVDTSNPHDLRITFIGDSVTYNSGGTAIKSINRDSDHEEVTLSRRRGYQIGNIDQDSARFRRRAEASINDYRRRIEHIRQDVIPPIEIELASMHNLEKQQQERISTQERQRDLATARIDALEAELTSHRNTLEKELATMQAKYPLLADHRALCQRRIREIENQIVRSMSPTGSAYDNTKLFEDRTNLKLELTQVENALREHLGDIISNEERERRETAINDLFQESRRQNDLREQINKRIIELRSELSTLQQTMTDKLVALDAQDKNIQSLLKQIEVLENPPVLGSIAVLVGPDAKFYASVDQDQEVLNAMQNQQLYLDGEIRQMPDRVQALKSAKDSARSKKNIAKWSMTEAAYDVISANADIVRVMEENRIYRASAATAAYFYDVISAGIEGGPAAIFADLTGKLLEHYALNDSQFFQMYDESELRAAYNGIQEEEPSMREVITSNYAFKQAASSTIEFMESGFQNEFSTIGKMWERRNATQAVAERAQDLLREQDTFSRQIGRAALEAEEAYERVLKNPSSTKEIRDAISKRQAVLARYQDNIARGFRGAAPLERANERLAKANKDISDLRKIDLKDAAKGVGKGLLVDTFKNLLTAQFDAREQEVWTRFFEKEVYYKLEYQKYKLAAANYWMAYDRWKEAQRYWQLLWTMSQELSADMVKYATGRQDGFHVVKNEQFYDDQGPVEMRMEVIGPTMGEEAFLLGEGSPPPQKELKGQPQATETAGTEIPSEGMNPNPTHQNDYQFIFDPTGLKTLKPGGELPVRVMHQ